MLDPLPVSGTSVGPEALRSFARLVRSRFGLAQPGRRLDALEQRLRTACALSGLEPHELVRQLQRAGEDHPAVLAVADAITNQETSFFRDVEQLSAAVTELVPSLCAGAGDSAPLQILSAGCASGEEAYSLAMLLLDAPQLLWGRAARIAGVDLSPSAIEKARSGSFRASAVARAGNGPAGWHERFFTQDQDRLVARGLLRSSVRFARANLLSPPSLAPLGRFDLVVCRNVLIYFDAETMQDALQALFSLLRPGGALVLGHAEAGLAHPLQHTLCRSGRLSWFRKPEVS